jgi:acid phosphatase family membrane protein YuiD
MFHLIRDMPFVVAILAGIFAQVVKVVSFLVMEKRVDYRRFVETDGMPNMHSTTFSALTIAVGLTAGFGSVVFGLVLCLTSIVLVDTMNVKNAQSMQAEAVALLLERLRGHRSGAGERRRNSYTPLDVFAGVIVGAAFALLFYH